MKVLVTGGLGFQGSNLCEELVFRGYLVTALNTLSDAAGKNLSRLEPDRVKVVWGSVTDSEVVHKTVREHNLVFHLAANIHVDESRVRPRDFFETNVMGTFNVVEACRRFIVPLFHVSSCEVYGDQFGTLTEESPMKPASPYAASKAAAENLVCSYAKTYGLKAMIVRPGNVFGPGQRGGPRGAMIPRFVESALNNEDIVLYGDGTQRRDFVYVKDLVRAYLQLCEGQGYGAKKTDPPIYNIATGRDVQVKWVAEKVVELLGSKSDIVIGPRRPGEVSTFNLASGKLMSTGFSWKWIFEEGLKDYIQETVGAHA